MVLYLRAKNWGDEDEDDKVGLLQSPRNDKSKHMKKESTETMHRGMSCEGTYKCMIYGNDQTGQVVILCYKIMVSPLRGSMVKVSTKAERTMTF